MPADDPSATLTEESAPTTRCRIIATAARSFREIGYQKTTVADIAKSLKMSPANVYRFFDSKKAINEAVVARITSELEAMITIIADAPGLTAAERIREIVILLHRDCRERCEAFPRMHEMVEAAMTESWDVCRMHVDRIDAVFARVIGDGVANGEFAVPDPAAAATCIQAAIVRFCNPLLVSQWRAAPVPPLDTMIEFLLGSLRRNAGVRPIPMPESLAAVPVRPAADRRSLRSR